MEVASPVHVCQIEYKRDTVRFYQYETNIPVIHFVITAVNLNTNMLIVWSDLEVGTFCDNIGRKSFRKIYNFKMPVCRLCVATALTTAPLSATSSTRPPGCVPSVTENSLRVGLFCIFIDLKYTFLYVYGTLKVCFPSCILSWTTVIM